VVLKSSVKLRRNEFQRVEGAPEHRTYVVAATWSKWSVQLRRYYLY